MRLMTKRALSFFFPFAEETPYTLETYAQLTHPFLGAALGVAPIFAWQWQTGLISFALAYMLFYVIECGVVYALSDEDTSGTRRISSTSLYMALFSTNAAVSIMLGAISFIVTDSIFKTMTH